MDFFYPNLQNDMWRIFGLIFFKDKDYFLTTDKKAFNKDLLVNFLTEKGIQLHWDFSRMDLDATSTNQPAGQFKVAHE